MSLAFSIVFIDPVLKGPSFQLHPTIYSLHMESIVLTFEKNTEPLINERGPLEGPLAEKVCPFIQRRKGLIYLQVCSACNTVFGKMSGSHELKKVVIWEIHLLIELASRKT